MKLNTGIIKITINYAKWFIPGIKDLIIIKKNNAIHEKKKSPQQMSENGRRQESEGEWIRIYVLLNSYAVHLKLSHVT